MLFIRPQKLHTLFNLNGDSVLFQGGMIVHQIIYLYIKEIPER